MPIKNIHKDVFSKSTKTKLDIFEKYLTSWLPVFIHTPSCKSVNICDFFAGPGQDVLCQPGSPLRILNVIESFKDSILKNNFRINILLNELDKRKYENLKESISGKFKQIDMENLVSIRVKNEDFKNLFDSEKERLKSGTNLIFLDQNGIKHVKDNIIWSLEQFPRTDYMFFISSSYFIRFRFQDHFPGLDIDRKNTKHTEIHNKILNYYKNLLPPNSKTKLYPFTLKNGRNIFGIIFGSKHPLAWEKFLNIAWNTNELNGTANFDINEDYGKMQRSLFGQKPLTKLEQFKEEFKEFVLTKKEFTNKDILNYTLEKSYSPKTAANNLKQLRDEGIVEKYTYPKINCEQVYKNKNIITFKIKK